MSGPELENLKIDEESEEGVALPENVEAIGLEDYFDSVQLAMGAVCRKVRELRMANE